MTRQQKIQALAAIAEGKAKPTDLSEAPKIIAWQDNSQRPPGWRINGQRVPDAEYKRQLAAFREASHRRQSIGQDAGYFISVIYQSKQHDPETKD